MSIYEALNNRQQEAVYHTEGPLLILAGAGLSLIHIYRSYFFMILLFCR